MKWSKWLENWDMTKLSINAQFLQMEWEPQTADKDAAWEMYIELLTRVTSQTLEADNGNEVSALNSLYALFDITRSIIKSYGRDCSEFTKIAIIVLNQIIRPFTTKWHSKLINESFNSKENLVLFRDELKVIQVDLQKYTKMLSEMAGVEDLSDLQK